MHLQGKQSWQEWFVSLDSRDQRNKEGICSCGAILSFYTRPLSKEGWCAKTNWKSQKLSFFEKMAKNPPSVYIGLKHKAGRFLVGLSFCIFFPDLFSFHLCCLVQIWSERTDGIVSVCGSKAFFNFLQCLAQIWFTWRQTVVCLCIALSVQGGSHVSYHSKKQPFVSVSLGSWKSWLHADGFTLVVHSFPLSDLTQF